jgi:hypothetical protein
MVKELCYEMESVLTKRPGVSCQHSTQGGASSTQSYLASVPRAASSSTDVQSASNFQVVFRLVYSYIPTGPVERGRRYRDIVRELLTLRHTPLCIHRSPGQDIPTSDRRGCVVVIKFDRFHGVRASAVKTCAVNLPD